ncbi:hypothetical protein HQ533_05055 [Candidatus Woesearchaeota archaeon]|nr:hypothetical protein [Candidatus Woesearchaeota archaeon]
MNVYNIWEEDHKANIEAYEEAENIDFASLSDKELYDAYEKLYHANVKQGASGYLADSFLSVGETDWFSEFIISFIPDRNDKEEVVVILTAPTIPSYVNEEAIDLARIAKKVKGDWKSFEEFYEYVKKDKEIWTLLQDHVKKHYWVQNNYFPLILKEEDFAKKIFELDTKEDYEEMLTQNKKKKDVLLKEINNDHLTNVVRMSELMTHMQDYRKMGLVRIAHFMKICFEEMGKRMNLTVTDLRNTIEDELEDMFLNKNIDREKLRQRIEKNFACGFPEGCIVYEGEDLKTYVNESDFIENYGDIKEILGMPASPGLVKGRVRLVKDAQKAYDFKEGEILVTNNTTPEFVPIMKKAAAIVTEQGGITTHAAIISRELKIPCVIGTKIATKVLKDGDLVEVDANKGIVKKLK